MKQEVIHKVSIWLIPPPHLFNSLQAQIKQISKLNNTPEFIPHITLVGGVIVQSEKQGLDLFHNLKQKFQQSSDTIITPQSSVSSYETASTSSRRCIPCRFVRDAGIVSAYEEEEEKEGISLSPPTANKNRRKGILKWNQSCVAIIERSNELMFTIDAILEGIENVVLQKNRSDQYNNNSNISPIMKSYSSKDSSLSSSSSSKFEFPPPLCEPHYSFAYGSISTSFYDNENVNDAIFDIPPDFDAHELVFMWTYPSNLEGVKQWKEIGRISLLQ
jgi:hypothetical protein